MAERSAKSVARATPETDSHVGSVSQLIARAKAGDELAFAKLHQRYWPSLVAIARGRINGAPLTDRDAEDVAQNAFIAFYHSLQRKQLPLLANRHQLFALMTHIVACRAINEIKRSTTQRRGGSAISQSTALLKLADKESRSPLEAALLRDCYDHYIDQLSETLKPFAEMHLAGYSNREIAARMECVERTVERKLGLLRIRWSEIAQAAAEHEGSGLP